MSFIDIYVHQMFRIMNELVKVQNISRDYSN